MLLLTRTTIGLHTRAAASDFRTARLLGVRANRVIAFAVVLSGLLAAAVAVMMTVQFPLVTPDFALHDTIIVLVGVVVGGIDRLWTATLGGFTIGFASGVINGVLPTDKTVYLPSAVFALVILVLLLRPAGLFAWGRPGGASNAYEAVRSTRSSQLPGRRCSSSRSGSSRRPPRSRTRSTS